eukprot:TRINITY_DN46948_c0_g1_i1.p1 TRINITY_DN46948_c0_g1~~TRINITY_DN46948_c0_g1_i1.p1  ORF type:complete len:852 (+),score=118.88 TRINITY_DN46948_c0_g1_i1:81-2636(+)
MPSPPPPPLRPDQLFPELPPAITNRKGMSVDGWDQPVFDEAALTPIPCPETGAELLAAACTEAAQDADPEVAQSLCSPSACDFIADLFWWVFVHVFAGGKYRNQRDPVIEHPPDQQQRFGRLAESWFGLASRLWRPSCGAAYGDPERPRREAKQLRCVQSQVDRRFLVVPTVLCCAVVRGFSDTFPDCSALFENVPFRGYLLRLVTWWTSGVRLQLEAVVIHWWVAQGRRAPLRTGGDAPHPPPPNSGLSAGCPPPHPTPAGLQRGRRGSTFILGRRRQSRARPSAPELRAEELRSSLDKVRQQGREREAAMWRSLDKREHRQGSVAADGPKALVSQQRQWWEEGMRCKTRRLPRGAQWNAKGLSPLLREFQRRRAREAYGTRTDFRLAVRVAQNSPEPDRYGDLRRRLKEKHALLERTQSEAEQAATDAMQQKDRSLAAAIESLDGTLTQELAAVARDAARAPARALSAVSAKIRRADRGICVLTRSRASLEAEVQAAQSDILEALDAIEEVLGAISAAARRRLLDWSVAARAAIERARRSAEVWLDTDDAASELRWFTHDAGQDPRTPEVHPRAPPPAAGEADSGGETPTPNAAAQRSAPTKSLLVAPPAPQQPLAIRFRPNSSNPLAFPEDLRHQSPPRPQRWQRPTTPLATAAGMAAAMLCVLLPARQRATWRGPRRRPKPPAPPDELRALGKLRPLPYRALEASAPGPSGRASPPSPRRQRGAARASSPARAGLHVTVTELQECSASGRECAIGDALYGGRPLIAFHNSSSVTPVPQPPQLAGSPRAAVVPPEEGFDAGGGLAIPPKRPASARLRSPGTAARTEAPQWRGITSPLVREGAPNTART